MDDKGRLKPPAVYRRPFGPEITEEPIFYPPARKRGKAEVDSIWVWLLSYTVNAQEYHFRLIFTIFTICCGFRKWQTTNKPLKV